MDDQIVAGAAEQRRDALFLARSREDLRPDHRELDLLGGQGCGLGEFFGNGDRGGAVISRRGQTSLGRA